jgi:large subunit ribosomal protein L10
MAKLKPQKEKDLEELTGKLAEAKSAVFTDYRGTTVKDLDKLRKSLKKEGIFSKVYKVTLLKKAMEKNGIPSASVDYKTPVILALSNEEETAPARIIKNLAKDIKTIAILEGFVDKQIMSKAQVEALGDLPSKDQLRAQFLSVLNGPMAAFVRLLDAYGKKQNEGSAPAAEAKQEEPAPVAAAEDSAPASAEPSAEKPAEEPVQEAPADAAPAAA